MEAIKSTSSSDQILGGKLVCWSAKKQQSASMSSAEAEYVAAAGCCANDRYAVSNGSRYAVLIYLSEYVVLDRKLDTPYPMEVDTPYSTVDQNSVQIRRIFLDGYGVLVFRIVIFKISSFKL
ncbi:hypothetical protein Tco_0747818 [Tanacetum coccineum]|uniref:Uncharacterized protein n=1 Tax=Tanacetum coccineum TaxID=301880 RepID=A0ABQ4YWK0_9ASTR